MKSEPYPLGQLLLFQRRYVVPTFQRDYEWTREEQWELLVEDLVEASQRLAVSSNAASPHFLGAIVLDVLPSDKAAGLQLRSVIDGQQRLTTLQLLIRSLLDIAKDIDSKKDKQLRRLLRNPDDLVTSDHEAHKLWPRKRDRDIWLDVMSDCLSKPLENHPYYEAREYFTKEIGSHIAEQPPTSATVASFNMVVDALLDLFKIVVIELDGEDDAQVIFEVLNGRQTPLSASDLVKNLLFLRAERENQNDIDTLYDEYWEPFDADWWKVKVGSGHAARPHTDRMLAAWLTAVADKPVFDPKRLYGLTRRYLASSPLEVELILSEIAEYAVHYREFYTGRPDNPRIGSAYTRLRELGYLTVIPLLLWLRQQSIYGNLDAKEYEQAVLDIESYLLRRALNRNSTREYGRLFWNILQEVLIDPVAGHTASIIREALCRLEGNAQWPSDRAIREAFINNRYYGAVAQYIIKMVLSAIEEQMKTDHPAIEHSTVDYSRLTLEHIMPQKWQTNWPIEGEGSDLLLATQRRNDDYIHRIGNLTLVNPPLNALQSNRPWAEKRKILQQFSTLRMNTDLTQNSRWATWNEEAIEHRGEQLAEYAIRTWQRP